MTPNFCTNNVFFFSFLEAGCFSQQGSPNDFLITPAARAGELRDRRDLGRGPPGSTAGTTEGVANGGPGLHTLYPTKHWYVWRHC